MYFVISGQLSVFLQKSVYLNQIREIEGFSDYQPYQLSIILQDQKKSTLMKSRFGSGIKSSFTIRKDVSKRNSSISRFNHSIISGEESKLSSALKIDSKDFEGGLNEEEFALT